MKEVPAVVVQSGAHPSLCQPLATSWTASGVMGGTLRTDSVDLRSQTVLTPLVFSFPHL